MFGLYMVKHERVEVPNEGLRLHLGTFITFGGKFIHRSASSSISNTRVRTGSSILY